MTAATLAVVFDFFGTLTPGLPVAVVEASMARVAARLGVEADAFSRAMVTSWGARSVGALGDSTATLAAVARLAGVDADDDRLRAAHRTRMDDFGVMARLRPEAPTVLGRLHRAGIRTCVISDCPPELAELWPTLPVSALVDDVVLSAVEGIKKPSPGMFLAAARRLGVAPEACLYVGDGGSDELRGARSVGMTVVAIAEVHAQGALYVHDPAIPADVPVITSLTEVPLLAGCGEG